VVAIIQAKASVIDMPLNWETLFKEKFSTRAWENALIMLKNYIPPIVCTTVWFFYFSKSKWIAERITPKKIRLPGKIKPVFLPPEDSGIDSSSHNT